MHLNIHISFFKKAVVRKKMRITKSAIIASIFFSCVHYISNTTVLCVSIFFLGIIIAFLTSLSDVLEHTTIILYYLFYFIRILYESTLTTAIVLELWGKS